MILDVYCAAEKANHLRRKGREGAKPDFKPGSAGHQRLVEQVQFFAGFKADGAPGSDRHFGAGPGIASDSGLARLYAEDAKTTQLNAVAGGQSALHAGEDSIDGSLSLHPRKAGAFGDLVYHVLFDQLNDSLQAVGCPQVA